MAGFTRVHGDYLPVLHLDSAAYAVGAVNATSTGNVVQPQGPKLDFFTIALANVASNTTIANDVVLTVQELSTIGVYQFNQSGGTGDTLCIAVYPTSGWNTTTLKAAVDGIGVGTSTVTSSATFTTSA